VGVESDRRNLYEFYSLYIFLDVGIVLLVIKQRQF
jgi:hypothetical protein